MNPAEQADQKNSIAYYEHHAARLAAGLANEPVDQAALREFTSRVTGPRILDAGCGVGRELAIFQRLGFQPEGLDGAASLVSIARQNAPGAPVQRGDLLFYSPPTPSGRESYDGLWAHQSLVHLNAVGWQRVLASFFAALKPGGILFVSAREGQGIEEDREGDPAGPARYFYLYGQSDLASLVRQHGFQLLSTGRSRNGDKTDRLAFIARRILSPRIL